MGRVSSGTAAVALAAVLTAGLIGAVPLPTPASPPAAPATTTAVPTSTANPATAPAAPATSAPTAPVPTPAAPAPATAGPAPATAAPTTAPLGTATHTITGHVDLGDAAHPAGAGDVAVYYYSYDAASDDWSFHDSRAAAQTDAAGNFTLDVGPATIVMPEYLYAGAGNYLSTPRFDYPAPTAAGVIHFTGSTARTSVTLFKGGEVDGRVTDASGAPLAGLQVDLYSTNTGGYGATESATTRADGTYTIARVPSMTYRVQVSGKSGDDYYFTQFRGGSITHLDGAPGSSVTAGQTVTGMDVTAYRGSNVSGQITCFDDCQSRGSVWYQVEARESHTAPWVVVSRFAETSQDGPKYGSYNYIGYLGEYRVTLHYIGPGEYDDVVLPPVVLTLDGVTQEVDLLQHPVAAAGVSHQARAFITSLYVDYLDRLPAAAEVTFWGAQLSKGASRGAIATGFASSDEFRLDAIDAAYRRILGREPDARGRLFWLDQMHRGRVTTDDVNRYFYASDEFLFRSTDVIDWARQVYGYVLGRYPASGEALFWAEAGETHARGLGEQPIPGYGYLDRDWVVAQIYNSTEAARGRVEAMYEHYLRRPTWSSSELDYWTPLDAARGDSVVVSGITTSDEYYTRSSQRYQGS